MPSPKPDHAGGHVRVQGPERGRDQTARFLDGIKRLEAKVLEKWKSESDHPIPTEVEGADMLYVALAGAHSIVPAAAVFNAAGQNWTLSFFEAVNFGAFVGDRPRPSSSWTASCMRRCASRSRKSSSASAARPIGS